MQYILKVPKISGETMRLFVVAGAMARAKATAYGSTSFHGPTYDNVFRGICTSIVREVKSSNLAVCDNNGFPQAINDVIEQGKRDGAFNAMQCYVQEPNWARLEAQHPEAEIAPGCWHWGYIDIGGKSEPDVLMSELHYFQTSLHYLNEWGSKTGNTFTLVEMPVEMVDFDLKDMDGNVIEAGYYRGFVSVDQPANAPARQDAQAATKGEAGTVTSQSGDSNKQTDIANQVYWRAVLQSHIKQIDEYRKANVRKIIKYLRKLEDKRLPNEGKLDELTWIDDIGNKQYVAKKTVSNAASTARNLP